MAGRKGMKQRWLAFTIDQVAAAVGKSVRVVSKDARIGMFDKRNLESVSRYVVGKPTDLTEARRLYLALGVALGIDKQAPAWKPGDDWQEFGGSVPKVYSAKELMGKVEWIQPKAKGIP